MYQRPTDIQIRTIETAGHVQATEGKRHLQAWGLGKTESLMSSPGRTYTPIQTYSLDELSQVAGFRRNV